MGQDLTLRLNERVSAPAGEGVGMRFSFERNPAHEDPQWYELDLDDDIEDPDEPFIDPLPTERHRRVPGF